MGRPRLYPRETTCANCGRGFSRSREGKPRTMREFCSPQCRKAGQPSGATHWNWRGGRTLTPHGYVLIKRRGHRLADCRGYVYEHRLVAEEMVGRPLLPTDHVHHRNGDTQDNRPENLEVTDGLPDHKVRHRTRPDLRKPGESNPEITCGCGCGRILARFDSEGRPRGFLPGHSGRGRKRTGQTHGRPRDTKGRFSKCIDG